jgi:hypothetical protein
VTGEPAVFSTHRAAALLAVVPDALAAEVRALGRDGARWRPAPDAWSVAEVVGHLIEAERRGFAGRIREILRSDDPELRAWDQAAVSAARDDRAADPVALVAELRASRLEGVGLVRTLTADDLARSGVHPDVGALRVDELVAEWVHHDRCHLRQALGVAEAWAWLHMGAARRFDG